MPSISHSRSIWLVICVVSVFFVHLGSAKLWDRDEPRNSRASHEMLARGDWIVPTFNDELRAHKPVLLYWTQMTAYSWLGESEFTARLPSALSALLSALVIAVLASRLSGSKAGINREGWLAAGALGTCMFFVLAGRAATPDGLLVAFSTLGIGALVIASLRSVSPYSAGQVGSARWGWAILGYSALGLAALAKGPVGIILPLAVVHLWWLCCRGLELDEASSNPKTSWSWITKAANPILWLKSLWALKTIPGVILCLAIAAPWYILVGIETEGAFLRGFFIDHNVGRAMNAMEGHNGSIFFYPVAFLAGTFPWSLWLIPIGMWCSRAVHASPPQRQMVVLSCSWIAIYITAFSIASTKLPSYITPCYGGAALAIGSFLRQYETSWHVPSIRWRQAGYLLTTIVGLTICGVLLWVSNQETMPNVMWAGLAGLVLASVGVIGWVLDRAERLEFVPSMWVIAAAAFQVIIFGFGAATASKYRDDVQMLSEIQTKHPSTQWIAAGGFEPSWVHYLDCKFVELENLQKSSPQTSEPVWSQVAKALPATGQTNLVVVGQEKAEDMQRYLAQANPAWRAYNLASEKLFLKDRLVSVFRIEANTAPIDVASESNTLLR